VAYYRVSTRRQGGSGLGLEAQRRTVAAFCEANGYRVVDSFKDVERGKNDRWPGLKGAIERAKGLGAELLIAKLDRLSRNVEFTMHLRNSGVRFTACDLPEATR